MEGPESDSSREERNPHWQDPEVTRLLQQIRRSGQLAGASIVGCGLLACVVMLGALSVCIYQGSPNWQFGALFTGVVAGFAIIAWNFWARTRRAALIRRLANYQDKRIVPLMLSSLQSPDHGDDYAAFRAALLQTLPALTDGDQALLSPWLDGGLYYRLQTVEAAIICAFLDAIGRTGATRALPAVEWLLKLGDDKRYAPTHDSAAACADSLRKRMARTRSAQALLRSVDPSSEEELLRPANNRATPEPDHLLRPPSDQM